MTPRFDVESLIDFEFHLDLYTSICANACKKRVAWSSCSFAVGHLMFIFGWIGISFQYMITVVSRLNFYIDTACYNTLYHVRSHKHN